MPKKLTKAVKGKIKRYEKDEKEDKKLWSRIKGIKKKDSGMLRILKKFSLKKPSKRAKKKK